MLLDRIKSKITRKFLRAVQILILLVIFFFLGRNLYYGWGELVSYQWKLNCPLLGLSLVLMIACGFLVAMGWNLILRCMGKALPQPRTLRIYFLSELGKYLPGKVWTVMGRVFLTEREGVPKLLTAASVGVMLIVMVISGIMVVLMTLPAWPTLEEVGRLGYFIFLVPVGLLALHPRIFNPLLNWVLEKFEHLRFQINLRYSNTLSIVLLWCALWVIKGIATYTLLIAVYHEPLPPFAWISLTGIVAISWVVGTLSFIAPAGLGVAEMVTVLLFGSLFSIEPGIATAMAIFFRIWGILAELICVALTFRLK